MVTCVEVNVIIVALGTMIHCFYFEKGGREFSAI